MADDDMLDEMNRTWAQRRLDEWHAGGPAPTHAELNRIAFALIPEQTIGTPEWFALHPDDWQDWLEDVRDYQS